MPARRMSTCWGNIPPPIPSAIAEAFDSRVLSAAQSLRRLLSQRDPTIIARLGLTSDLRSKNSVTASSAHINNFLAKPLFLAERQRTIR
jgi:hypothetical protein